MGGKRKTEECDGRTTVVKKAETGDLKAIEGLAINCYCGRNGFKKTLSWPASGAKKLMMLVAWKQLHVLESCLFCDGFAARHHILVPCHGCDKRIRSGWVYPRNEGC